MRKKFLSFCLICFSLVFFALPSFAEGGLTLAYDYFGMEQCVGGCANGCATGCMSMVLNSILEVIPTKTISLRAIYGTGFDDYAKGIPFGLEIEGALALGFEANPYFEVFPGIEMELIINDKESAMNNFSLGNKINYFPQTMNSKPYLTASVNFCWNDGKYKKYLLETNHVYFRTNFGMGMKLSENLRFEATYNMFLLGSSTMEHETTGELMTSRLKDHLSFGLIFGRFTLPKPKAVKAAETEEKDLKIEVKVKESKGADSETEDSEREVLET